MKRLLPIILLIIAVIVVVGAMYWFFFRPTAHLILSPSNPFADTNSSGTITTPAEPVTSEGNAGTVVAANLIEITSSPVAAGVSISDVVSTTSLDSTASSSTSTTSAQNYGTPDVIVHYIDRESGNVYSYGALSRTLTRISDKTLPGIQLASWTPDGSLAIVQFLAEVNGSEQLDSYALPANSSSDAGGFFLQGNLSEALATAAGKLFTLTSDGNGGSVAGSANTDGTNVQTLFDIPLSSITVYPAGTGYIVVTKPTSELDGYVFSVNASGNLTPILGPLKGLSALPSNSGTQLLYSYTDGSTYHMAILDFADGTTTQLPVATLAEKCVWTSDDSALYCGIPESITGNEPDNWYQGTTSFEDRIWRLDLSTHLATLILDPSKSNVSIDAVNLAIDPNQSVLVFRNKVDSSLWAYTLSQ